jgi:hypothetical protein
VELEAREEELKTAGWLRITVPLDAPDLELARKVKERLPKALIIKPELPHQEVTVVPSRDGKSPVELYRDYHMQEHGRLPDPGVEETFQRLYSQCGD